MYQVRNYVIVRNYLNIKLEQRYKTILLNSGYLKRNVDTEDHNRTGS
jgi:hypothetical protein